MSTVNERSVYNKDVSMSDMARFPVQKYAALSRLVLRDLNGTNTSSAFYLYTKDQITTFLKDPSANEKNLRNAIIYIYGASSHFRRLIQYFSSLSDLSYIVSPYGIDSSTVKPQTVRRNYNKVMKLLSSLDIKNQFSKVLTVCLREDVFYGTMRIGADNIIIQQLPSDYCTIAVIENNVLNVSFDFSYFDTNSQFLDMYPDEFRVKYAAYQKDRTGMKWQELESPTSFAVKCSNDILTYAMPPFAGILREIYDLEDLNVKTNRSAYRKRYVITIPLTAGKPLESYKLQHSDEINIHKCESLRIIRIG